MNRTAVIFSSKYYQHNPGRDHPESSQRLRTVINELKRGPLAESRSWQFASPEKATLEDVELVHGLEYIRLIEAVCRSGGGLLDLGDTQVSRESYEVALYAVGGALRAVKLVADGEFQNAFALVRPPGHHASKFRACGFCLFNNIAIAAKYLLEKQRLKRILILDVDAHHGNGTQETFYDTDKVLFISLHEDPTSFPGTGFTDEIGEGEGLGYNVNIPLPYGTGDRVYMRAVDEIVKPVVLQYRPQFVLVSAGFDGHYSDPVANLSLTHSCYQQVFEAIASLALKECGGRVVSVLEGGYNLSSVGKTAALAIAAMSRSRYIVHDKATAAKVHTRKLGEKALAEVKRVQRDFWSIE
jgi:acetoin utilization deacetylase AcuC-like enzyme